MKVQNTSHDDTCIIPHGGTFKAIFPGEVIELDDAEAHAALKQHAPFLKEIKALPSAKVKIEPEVR